MAYLDPRKGERRESAETPAIADIPSPGSATAPTCAAKINELLAAMRAANLVAT